MSSEDTEIWAKDSLADYVKPSGSDTEDEAAMDKAMELKGEAGELASEGKYDAAIAKMTEALKAKPSSAMWWAFRADIYLKAKRPLAAISDATEALERNPDSARALRVRGFAQRHLGEYEKATEDLSAAQRIDFDEKAADVLKFLEAKYKEVREERRRLDQEEKEKRQAELRAQREREQREEAAERAKRAGPGAGGFPGGGMPPGGFPGGGMPPGGMGGMPGGMPGAGGMPGMPPGGIPPEAMAAMQDPEIQEMMKDPEVMMKLSTLMTNPAGAMQMMNDPKMGPILMKFMEKMGGVPGMGGMPGAGMGGMPPGPPPSYGAQPSGGQGPSASKPKPTMDEELD